MNEELQSVVEQLRNCSERLETHKGTVILPGWDFESGDHESIILAHQIRNAAWAIINNTDCDSSVRVTKANMAALIHYVADMLEE